ncbi:hypothetical protein O6H91_Y099800 [Diphasiastrum complanatum]|nr:hypothetical protein O6H91_Y099800 [Diphasiastrum complanatum]KAJ7296763.1 hypothetical protein O6H91_Y099800 [Diphasiastrum complanatum]
MWLLTQVCFTSFQVHPRKIPHPKASALPPNAHMLHNLAHIELNAIDLAWDTVVRFSYASSQLGTQFFADFAHVADDESRHLCWCLQRLSELGFRYGDMPAHNLLWRDCHKTSEHVDARLAIIPMVQEARGLDAGPRLVERLIGLDDNRSAGIVQCISEEEVAHVAVGVSWFYRVCSQQGIEPSLRFKDLMISNGVTLKGPFNYAARTMAGIPRDWYDASVQDGYSMSIVGSLPSTNEMVHAIPSQVHERLAQIIVAESKNNET